MEDNFEEKSLLSDDLTLTDVSKSYLKETAKWGNFLGIVGFIFSALIAIASLFAGTAFSSINNEIGAGLGGGFIVFFYMLGALIYFFPSYYLFQSSAKLKDALKSESSDTLELALSRQKSFFKFWGIFTIIMMIVYGCIIFFALIGAVM